MKFESNLNRQKSQCHSEVDYRSIKSESIRKDVEVLVAIAAVFLLEQIDYQTWSLQLLENNFASLSLSAEVSKE